MDLWGVAHPALDLERFPGAASRKSSTVGLPIHQELRRADIARLADAVRISASNPPARLRVETVDTLDAFKEEWQVLAESSRNVFLTWEWISTWWRYFGNGRPLRVSLCSGADDTAVGIVPLYEATRIPVKLLRFLGHGASDELGPVCPTDDPSLAARVLSMTLARLDEPWDLFLGERLRAEGSWESIPGASVVRRDSSPRLRFGGQDWETFLSSLSSNLRAQIRRRERRLASSYRVHYRLATDENRLDDDLDSLFRLHRARWAEVETSFSAIEAFHRETAAIALERRWLRLWFLELDGNPVAAWYGFRFGGVEAYYQAGRDPRYSDLSVGFVLLVHTIRAAIEDGVREYRFLRGGEAYKHRFTSDDPGLLTFGLPRTPAGAAVVLLTAALGEHHPVMRLARRQLDRGSGCSVRRTVP
jgi:CelD/BcsL family acetyltransferase involved in cellulose biosynthesis